MPFVVILSFDWILQDGIKISQPSVNTMSISGSGVPSGIALASAAAPSSEQLNLLPLGSIRAIIAATLEIPDHLIDRTKGNDIHLAYAKYLAIADALAKLSSMSRSGTWKLKNNNDDVIEIFVAESSYFRNYTKCFSLVKHYPGMKEWLGGAEGAPDDHEVWGYDKQTFDNLFKILTLHEQRSAVKGKGKARNQDDSSSPVEKKQAPEKNKKAKRKEEIQKKASVSGKVRHGHGQ